VIFHGNIVLVADRNNLSLLELFKKGKKENMKIKELKEILSTMDDNLELYLQIDEEGNGYHAIVGIDDNAYIEYEDITQYCPELYSEADIIECELINPTQVAVIFP
jgi:hypothetical protein